MAKTNYEFVKDWRKRNPEKVRAQSTRRRAKCPEKFAEASKRFREKHGDRLRPIEAERARAKRRNDPEGQRARMAKFKAKKEAEKVAIAGRPRPSICDICRGNHHLGIVWDHCHESGKFRGWLCDRCNKVLGLVKDDVKLLRGLGRYLNRHGKKVDTEGDQTSWGFAPSLARSRGRKDSGQEDGESG